jgi:hypothetical protein
MSEVLSFTKPLTNFVEAFACSDYDASHQFRSGSLMSCTRDQDPRL